MLENYRRLVAAVRRLGEGGRRSEAAVIVGAGDEEFFPRLRVSRRETVAVREFRDALRRERTECVRGDAAVERVA